MHIVPPPEQPLFTGGECPHEEITIDYEVVSTEWDGRLFPYREEYRFTCATCGAISTTKTINITSR